MKIQHKNDNGNYIDPSYRQELRTLLPVVPLVVCKMCEQRVQQEEYIALLEQQLREKVQGESLRNKKPRSLTKNGVSESSPSDGSGSTIATNSSDREDEYRELSAHYSMDETAIHKNSDDTMTRRPRSVLRPSTRTVKEVLAAIDNNHLPPPQAHYYSMNEMTTTNKESNETPMTRRRSRRVLRRSTRSVKEMMVAMKQRSALALTHKAKIANIQPRDSSTEDVSRATTGHKKVLSRRHVQAKPLRKAACSKQRDTRQGSIVDATTRKQHGAVDTAEEVEMIFITIEAKGFEETYDFLDEE